MACVTGFTMWQTRIFQLARTQSRPSIRDEKDINLAACRLVGKTKEEGGKSNQRD